MTDPAMFKVAEELRYEDGEVRRYFNDVVQEAIKVRVAAEDAFIRSALVAELRRLGYVVIAPEESE